MAEKILYILRHAKTEPLAPGQEDHARPLAEKGVADAKNLGKYLLAQKIRPQQVWCSTATRTRQTWQHVQAMYGETVPAHYDDALYHISLYEMLYLLKKMPEKTGSLLWIGHNPGLHELCVRLSLEGEYALRSKMAQKFPPCSFVELRFDGNWNQIEEVICRLHRFVTPGDI
ncbi:MAG: histidine phosphatase family protein [Alphaproteobacteria bacterium]